ncbi:hypothetical protein FRB90_001107, partial [Tulasnella sp. 427]
ELPELVQLHIYGRALRLTPPGPGAAPIILANLEMLTLMGFPRPEYRLILENVRAPRCRQLVVEAYGRWKEGVAEIRQLWGMDQSSRLPTIIMAQLFD